MSSQVDTAKRVYVEFTQPAIQPEGVQFIKSREELRDSWDLWLSRDGFRGREGVQLEQKGGAIFTFDGAKIARFEAFFDHETARREFERLNAV
jgi:hypothetical protein